MISTTHFNYYQTGNPRDAAGANLGGLALMGGSTDVDDVFEWMAERGGGGDFLVLRGSGSDGYQDYIGEVAEVDSVETLVLKSKEAAQDPFVLERVAQADAIFLAGGDQWNYVGKWKDTELVELLNDSLQRGVPIGGTSAGLAVLGEHVFTAERDTITSEQALADPFHPAITLESEFLESPPMENLITDSHFSERDRMGRLVTFMSRLQSDGELAEVRGVGVDERTAVLVEPDGNSRTVGENQAHFVMATGTPEVCLPGQPLSHSNLEVHSVSGGQDFDLASWSSESVEPHSLRVSKGHLEEV